MDINNGIFLQGDRDFGVLLLHGFTAQAEQMREIAQSLNAQGFTVRAPMLPGHGEGAEALENVTWRDWLACARQEYTLLRQECGKVAVAGLSMGGALAAILAEEYPVEALVLFSPCLRMKQGTAWAARIVRIGKVYKMDGEGRREFPLWKGYDVWRLAAKAMMSAFAVTCPVLVFQSALDTTIDPRGAKQFVNSVSSQEKEYFWLEKSGHVCTHGPEKAFLIGKTVEFFSGVRAGGK